MIKSLIIKNFVLIDDLEINFSAGLNILTGETGAGKSILIDAIDLAFGARASKDQIKVGANKALIELNLELPNSFPKEILEENGIEVEEDNLLVVSREVSNSGTRSRINGVLITQSYIQNLREYLIDIHSQHETYTYIQPKTHIKLLDNYGDKNHQELLKTFNQIYSEYKEALNEYNLATSQIQESEQKVDFLQFQINEIEEAQIESVDEYEELMEEREVLVNAEDLKEITYSGYAALYGEDHSIIDILNSIEKQIIKASHLDKNLYDVAEIVASSAINLREAANNLRDYSQSLDVDQEKLFMLEERIEILDKLKRKYGPDLVNVLENLEKFSIEFEQISFSSENVDKLSKKLEILSNNLNNCALALSRSRKNLAEVLSAIIQNELIKLEMPKVQFEIKVRLKGDITSTGIDEVEFMISTNPGESLKPLAKIASGGEISRVMLAVKTIFAKADQVNTVIFDEIDTGISGKTSQVVGEELFDLGITHQVLCITHQPIIAAMADNYLYIEKIQDEQSTKVQVTNLSEEEKINVISKLASGSCEDTDSLNFATKLIQQSQTYKDQKNSRDVIASCAKQ